MENDRLNEIRELNPDYDISMHEDGTRRVKDTIHIPMSLVASFGSFD